MTSPRSSTAEVLASTFGACSLLLAAGTYLFVQLVDVPDGLDALGHLGLTVLGAAVAGFLAAAASVSLAVHVVRHGGRLRPWTWVLGVGPALVGGYLVVATVLQGVLGPTSQP